MNWATALSGFSSSAFLYATSASAYRLSPYSLLPSFIEFRSRLVETTGAASFSESSLHDDSTFMDVAASAILSNMQINLFIVKRDLVTFQTGGRK